MKELENKEISQIRFEFTDGTWFFIANHNLQFVSKETKDQIDLAISKAFNEIEKAGEIHDSKNYEKGQDLGVQASENIKSGERIG